MCGHFLFVQQLCNKSPKLLGFHHLSCDFPQIRLSFCTLSPLVPCSSQEPLSRIFTSVISKKQLPFLMLFAMSFSSPSLQLMEWGSLHFTFQLFPPSLKLTPEHCCLQELKGGSCLLQEIKTLLGLSLTQWKRDSHINWGHSVICRKLCIDLGHPRYHILEIQKNLKTAKTLRENAPETGRRV